MKIVLGLDLGVTSIGWALIEKENGTNKILDLGSRIIPLSPDDKNEFSSGNAISKNQKRTLKRTQRKGFDRYQLRRYYLKQELEQLDMLPGNELYKLSATDLFGLRDRAVKEPISLQQLGRILFHLNQKRGYKSTRKEDSADKKETEYISVIKGRYEDIKEQSLTVGQYFYHLLLQNKYERLKEKVFPRQAYEEEYDTIMRCQRTYYPEVLSEQVIDKIKNEIIYYQRPLKSQKGLVSVCELAGEWKQTKNDDGSVKETFIGPKVAPRSSPLFQVCKIWENINTVTIKNKKGETYNIPPEQKQKLFEYLDNNKVLSFSELLKILKLSKDDGWYGNKQLAKGLQGNTTKIQIANCLQATEGVHELLKFDLNKQTYNHTDKLTGEITVKEQIDASFEKQPLYVLWHMIYSIPVKEELVKALENKFLLPNDVCQLLAKLDFTKQAFGNKSARAIRKILSYLQQGFNYSDACALAGFNHSNSLTTEQNLQRQLKPQLKNLEKNSLRQPIVEKILNQMINLVNAIINRYEKIDEIRIELARELKQSKEERNNTFRNINERERKNKLIAERIENEYGLRSTKRNIDKWRLYEEADGRCAYCGKGIELSDFLKGDGSDVEHIIPKARLFDDSLQNKTIAHRKCNADKGNSTAYDFMHGKSEDEFNEYLERVETLYKKGISKAKRDKLLMSSDKIPKDFIDRQLRETQYIARKAKEILNEICYNVHATSGSVTDYLRYTWGWDEVLMNLQFDKYKEVGLTEWNDKAQREVIKGWSKRDDHRHHAIDALVITCTTQSIIQRLNNLNQIVERQYGNSALDELKAEESLKNFVSAQRPFTTKQVEDAAADILISMKAGKKVAATGTRKIKLDGKKKVVQENIIIPRGALSEESVYGKIKVMKQVPVNELFQQPGLIVKERIKTLVVERLNKFDDNVKKAIASLKKEPVYVNDNVPLTFGTVYKEEYVIKYPVETLTEKDVNSIVDKRAREVIKERLAANNNNSKQAFKDLENNPVYLDEAKTITVKTVRCFTGLSAVEPVNFNEQSQPVAFVKPGNNHHIAIYSDEAGNMIEHSVTFWNAVERKKYQIPVVIKNPEEVWEKLNGSGKEYPETFLNNLPQYNWQYIESLQQNEMFVLGLSNEEWNDATRKKDYQTISKHLYRVQKISTCYYVFRHHLETEINDSKEAQLSKRFISVRSLGAFKAQNPKKTSINILGKINTNNL